MDLSSPVSRKNFDFRLARFWSSPELVPGVTIIANVLTNPAEEDVHQVIEYFGLASVRRVMSMLKTRDEISKVAETLSEKYMQSYHYAEQKTQ